MDRYKVSRPEIPEIVITELFPPAGETSAVVIPTTSPFAYPFPGFAIVTAEMLDDPTETLVTFSLNPEPFPVIL